MIKKISSKLLPILAVCMLTFTLAGITGCATTPEKDAASDTNITETPKKQEKKAPEPQDPPNVKFVKQLRALLEKEDIKGAIAHFADIPSELKDDIELKNLLGALYYSDAQYDNAIATAEEVLSLDAENMEALELISLCNKAKGDKKAYKESADRILAVDPYNTSVNIQKAEEYALNKKYKLARDAYKKALRGDDKNEDALFGYAQMSYYVDDVKTAGETFQKILDKNPENPAALAYMGKLAYEDENYLRATKFVQEALKYDSKNYDYWMDYGTYLRYQGKFDDAAKAWKKAAELDPSYFLAYAYLAGNYDDLGKWDEALENYHKVIETNPKYFYAYESTAILEFHAKNYENAIKYFSKTYEFSPTYSYSLMIAACWFKLGKPLEAKKVLQAQLKKLDNKSTEYDLVRFYHDPYNRNAESNLIKKITNEGNSNNRGKMLFYMGLYYELNNAEELANEYYAKVTNMKAPMFFEYRIAEWGLNQ